MVDFEVLEIDVDEDEIQNEGPQEYLDRIVKSKVTAAGNKILQENLCSLLHKDGRQAQL